MYADREAIIDAARDAERLGFSTFCVSDHFMAPLAPLIALQAVADATSTLRLTQTVLDQDFRHPAVLAKDLATLDLLSGGRVEVGIGAGWMKEEYDQTGIRYDKPSVRIERLEEVIIILKGLFAEAPLTFAGKHFTITGLNGVPKPRQRPGPPIMVGGGGRKLLSVAARHADIIQVASTNTARRTSIDAGQFTAKAFEEKVGWIRDEAGERFEAIELGTQLLSLTVTDDRSAGVEAFRSMVRAMLGGAEFDLSEDEILESPSFAIGTVDQVAQKLLESRERFGFSYFTTGVSSSPESAVPVIERLAGK